jgi:hypothetical protein
MKVLLTDKLLEDIGSPPKALASKAQRLAIEFTRLSRRDMQDKLTAGWRVHKPKSSPFVSLSLDMNYRLLCRIDGETIALHRIVKHDLADSARVNREDSRDACFTVDSTPLRIADLYGCLKAIGLREDDISPLSGIRTEDDFLSAAQRVPPAVADLALNLIETDRFVYVRTKYCVLNKDDSFEKALLSEMSAWGIGDMGQRAAGSRRRRNGGMGRRGTWNIRSNRLFPSPLMI